MDGADGIAAWWPVLVAAVLIVDAAVVYAAARRLEARDDGSGRQKRTARVLKASIPATLIAGAILVWWFFQ